MGSGGVLGCSGRRGKVQRGRFGSACCLREEAMQQLAGLGAGWMLRGFEKTASLRAGRRVTQCSSRSQQLSNFWENDKTKNLRRKRNFFDEKYEKLAGKNGVHDIGRRVYVGVVFQPVFLLCAFVAPLLASAFRLGARDTHDDGEENKEQGL